MSKQLINLGTNPNDGTGDNIREGGEKINANFEEIYGISGLLKSNGSDTISVAIPGTDYILPDDITLQYAYNNNKLIVTDDVNLALTIQRGSGSDLDLLFKILNGAGVTVSSITGEGIITTTGVIINGDMIITGTVDGRDIALDGTNQDNHIADNTLHFTQANISITESQISDFKTYALASQVLTDVPINALFTDTIYNDSVIQAEVDLNTSKISYTDSVDVASNTAARHTHTADEIAAITGSNNPSGTNPFATIDDISGAGIGDMLKAVYDTNDDGKVNSADNADTVNNLTVLKAVPVDALFTDTIYILPSDVVQDPNYVATDNNYSDSNKSKLDGVESGANNYVHPTDDGNKHVPANGTTNNGKVLTASATAGVYSWETISSGITDHLLLSNIGTKSHATLDSEVNINNAKVSNINHPLVETAVPLGALFTDTIYDDTAIQAEVDLNTAKETNIAHPLVETAVPVGALFTDTIYTSFDSDFATKTTSDLTEGINLYYTEIRVSANAEVFANTTHRSNTSNPHNVTATQISDFSTEVSNNTDVSLNTTHRSSNGSDHSFINQDVTSTASPTFNKQQFTPQSSPTHNEGLTFYDSDKKALSYFNDEADITVNLGQEVIFRVSNATGVTIPNGAVVTNSDSGLVLADNRFKDKSNLVTVATHDIENGSMGYVTRLGEVGGLDTSTFTSGQTVYLGEDGGYTSDRPTGGDFSVVVGVIKTVSATEGILQVNPRNSDLSVEVTDNNGFPDEARINTSLSFVDGTRTFTLNADTGDYHYYILGDKYEKTASESIVITDVTGIHVIYYDGETLTTVANPNSGQVDAVIRTKAIIAYVYWNATDGANYYIGDERHGISMSPVTHSYLHFTRGAQYLSGLALDDFTTGSGTVDADAQFSIASGLTADEDLVTFSSGTASTVGLPIFYKTGANGDWKKVTQSGFSVYNTGSPNGRLYYNEWTGTAWQLTEISNNDFVLCHVFATNDVNNPIISIMGEEEYGNARQARNGANEEINNITTSGLPGEEFIPIASIIFKTNGGYANTINAYTVTTDEGDDYVDWRSTELSPGAGVSSHNNLTGLTNDDHIQYILTDGTRDLTGILSYSTEPTFTTQSSQLATVKFVEDTAGAGGITSVNGDVGPIVVLSTDDIADSATNRYTTDVDITRLINTSGPNTGDQVAGDFEHDDIANVNSGIYRHLTSIQVTDLTDGADSELHYHSTDRNRTNHAGTQTASTISDFDTEVSNNTSVVANTAKVGITTTQASDITSNNAKISYTDSAAVGLNTTHRGLTNNPHSVDKADVGLSAVPNTDFTSAVAANTAKTTNATHTGDVIGSTALTIASDVVDDTNLTTKFKGTSALTGTAVDWDLALTRTKTITADTTLTFSNLYEGVKFLKITGDFSITFPTGFTYGGGERATSGVTWYQVVCDNASTPTGIYTIIKNES